MQAWLYHPAFAVDYDLDPDVPTPVTIQFGTAEEIDPDCPYGYKSLIKIPESVYNDLAAAREHPEDAPRLLSLQLELAVIFIHEIGHALHNLIHGKLTFEHFLGDAIVFEVGFELEICLFGGLLTRLFYNEG